jgi:hypothetical protein
MFCLVLSPATSSAAPAVHPARTQIFVHQGDRAANRLDWSRLEFNISDSIIRGDGQPLTAGTRRAAPQHPRRGELLVCYGPLPRHPGLQVPSSRSPRRPYPSTLAHIPYLPLLWLAQSIHPIFFVPPPFLNPLCA